MARTRSRAKIRGMQPIGVPALRLEARFAATLVEKLSAAGHDVELLDEPYSDTMGHAGAVIIHQDGTLEAGHDPRADGGAAGV